MINSLSLFESCEINLQSLLKLEIKMKEKLIYAYKDKLTTFYKNIGEEFSNHSEFLSYITGIHIPGFGSEYPTAKRKILYMGIDTKGWDNIQKELERLNSSDYIEKAILYSCEELENFNFWRWFKPIKKNGNIGTSPFWNAVIKIHLAIKNISPSDSIKYGDKSKYENELNDFAWGNTHSIETYLHSNSKNEENSLDFNSYKKNSSKNV